MTAPPPSEMPTVSVVIPVYNAATTILEQLAALEDQRTERVWEVVVADNGSTDDTFAVAAKFAAGHPRVRIVDASARRGASAARNAGAAVARGDVLLFCDADDVASDTWLEEMARELETHHVTAGSLDVDRLNANNRASVTWRASGYVRFGFWPEFWAAPSSCLGVRRGSFIEAGGFDVHMPAGEDVDLCWRVQLRGGTMGLAEDAVMHVRRRDGLRRLARQAYVWGSGERFLQHKYALIAVAEPSPATPSAAVAAEPRTDGRLRRLARVRRIGDFADPVWRCGNAAGRRWARPPASLGVLAPDYRVT